MTHCAPHEQTTRHNNRYRGLPFAPSPLAYLWTGVNTSTLMSSPERHRTTSTTSSATAYHRISDHGGRSSGPNPRWTACNQRPTVFSSKAILAAPTTANRVPALRLCRIDRRAHPISDDQHTARQSKATPVPPSRQTMVHPAGKRRMRSSHCTYCLFALETSVGHPRQSDLPPRTALGSKFRTSEHPALGPAR